MRMPPRSQNAAPLAKEDCTAVLTQAHFCVVLAGMFCAENRPVVQALFWKCDALVACARDGRDEGVASPWNLRARASP
jgi:hypothetical protein